MSEPTTQPGITVRQRISVKQTAKGEFQRDYTVEIMGVVDEFVTIADPDVWLKKDEDAPALSLLNRAALQRAELDWLAHVERIKAGASQS